VTISAHQSEAAVDGVALVVPGERIESRIYLIRGEKVMLDADVAPRAIAVTIAVMRTFVRLRQMIASHADLARKLAKLESKYHEQFKIVFDAIRELMSPAVPHRAREVGFHTGIPALRPARTKKKKSPTT
jgi:hypothetical protein